MAGNDFERQVIAYWCGTMKIPYDEEAWRQWLGDTPWVADEIRRGVTALLREVRNIPEEMQAKLYAHRAAMPHYANPSGGPSHQECVWDWIDAVLEQADPSPEALAKGEQETG